MPFRFVLAALLAVASLPAAPQASNPNLGRNLAATCANCHNTTGKTQPGMPEIAGQAKDAMVRTLKEFKEGRRPATVMHQLVKGYTDEQLELVAAFFAAQK